MRVVIATGRIMVAMHAQHRYRRRVRARSRKPAYFTQFAPKGYALGINVLLHALTH
jgi:hypothetical protein